MKEGYKCLVRIMFPINPMAAAALKFAFSQSGSYIAGFYPTTNFGEVLSLCKSIQMSITTLPLSDDYRSLIKLIYAVWCNYIRPIVDLLLVWS